MIETQINNSYKPSIIYIVNNAAFFVSHRLPIAISARDLGFRVALITGSGGSPSMEKHAIAELKKACLKHHRVCFTSGGVNPLVELIGFFQLIFLMFKLKPDLVHCISPKANLYGGIVCRIVNIKSLVIAVSGRGFLFTAHKKNNFFTNFFSWAYELLFSFVLNHKNIHVIVQNPDDQNQILSKSSLGPSRVSMISGSGIQLADFNGISVRKKEKIVIFPARLLKDKGVVEFVDAVRLIKEKVPDWRFVLAGAADYNNPSAISIKQVTSWKDEGLIEWNGYILNMIEEYKKASIVCLPSYREGMPKALLEAAAAGCAVITTDVVGCRSAIVSGQTGDLVAAQNTSELANAMLALIIDRERRESYGSFGRKVAFKNFGIERVINSTVDIYQELILNAK